MNKKIITIGNAIVDIVCKIDDKFLMDHLLHKGSMQLIDEKTVQNFSSIPITKITSGGSAANSGALLAQLKNPVDFIGKVAADKIGKKFIEEIEKSGANFVNKKYIDSTSARSFILVAPNGERTMCTFLGCASEIYENDIDEKIFTDATILYLEGYLWDRPQTILALKKAISLAKKHNVKIAFTLSDLFCVARHKIDFTALLADIDILFANENEIKELLNLENFEEKNYQKVQNILGKKTLAAITCSEKGCVIFSDNNFIKIPTEPNLKPVDTTGAGDCFAAGFLFGINNNLDLEKSAQIANKLAAKIIQKFGARFDDQELTSLHDIIYKK